MNPGIYTQKSSLVHHKTDDEKCLQTSSRCNTARHRGYVKNTQFCYTITKQQLFS